MDLTFGGHRFLFGAEGSHRFLAPDFSGPSAKDYESPKSSAPLINSTGERHPPPNYTKPVKSGGLIEIFDKIAAGSNHGPIDNINFTQSEKVFTDPSDGVTCPSQSVWLPSLTQKRANEIASDP